MCAIKIYGKINNLIWRLYIYNCSFILQWFIRSLLIRVAGLLAGVSRDYVIL